MKTRLIFLFFPFFNFALAQTFVEVSDLNIEGVSLSWVEFADVDSDDDLDLLIQGQGVGHSSTYTKLFQNDGAGNFSEVENSPFSSVFLGDLAFADVDGDNDLDVLISGKGAWPNEIKSTKLYFNDGTGEFTASGNSPFVDVSHGSIAFADVDGDTDQDLLITGDNDGNSAITKLYLNDGLGSFTEQNNSPFAAVTSGSVAFADVDGDTDQDVLITGGSSVFLQGQGSVLYINDGIGNFTIKTGTPFEGVRYSSVDFADIDGDLDQDVLITGRGEQPFSGLYINDGVGNFSLSTEDQIYPVEFGCAAFADVDNDSDLDLFLTGANHMPPYPDWNNARLYINESQTVPNPPDQEDPISGFIVYPNPAKSSDLINISYDYYLTGILEYSIFNSKGNLVLHGNNCLELGNGKIQISITSLAGGLYFLKVQHDKNEEVFRLMVD
jgi:hypothetical protein